MRMRAGIAAAVSLAALVGCTSWNSHTTAPKDRAIAGSRPVVGQPAPDIVGADIDGEQFALADYRGKVVMLDFWGNW